MYLLGYDIGSSSIKAALVESESKSVVAFTQYPETEMEIISHQLGWAEQHPENCGIIFVRLPVSYYNPQILIPLKSRV